MRKPSLAVVLSGAALAVALTGTGASAAGLINGAQIRNHTISVAKLTPQAVHQLHGARGDTGPQGPMGNVGPVGSAGPAGANGGFDPNKVTYVTGPDTTIYPDSVFNTLTATCPPGTKVIGGGYFVDEGYS